MPRIEKEIVGIGIETASCPNRCRHCYYSGGGDKREMDVEDVLNIFQEFATYSRQGSTQQQST